ncbi:hypothetical protein BUALT_Bualt13G0034500 [Buddleja alternifolia]|uniref:Uncharacterized protein n=1 Tax=Buddleja alternifolia TaxID=168488 RepID=A0AAV6WV85_9LAMI|nr:hypothetical protein BUALT_Bualt13G0034500 [Buddleja alternifolia]
MAAVGIFHQAPIVKVSSSNLDNEIKNKSHYIFPCSDLKHKQQKSRGLSLRPLMSMASSSVFEETHRPVKRHGPSLWADISFSFDKQVQERYEEAVEALKEEIRSMVMAIKDSKPKNKMMLIDTLERLGVAYHFEKEIEDQIEQIFKFHAQDDNDLLNTSLYFRLFRQHGYNVPSSVFNKFKDKDNKFKKTLTGDIEGLLSLYEASYLMYHGEDTLEEAMVFTTHYLNEVKSKLNSYLQAKVTRALYRPIHRGVTILEARSYISIYEKKESKNELLLRLAKLNFKLLQNMYQKELDDLFKWWKGLNLTSKLPYLRDTMVENYFWAVAINFEPQYSFARLAVAKVILFTAVINDTCDSYATSEEVDLFMEIFQRWDIKEADWLPNCMMIACKFLSSEYEEFDNEVSKQGRSYAISYAIKAMKELGRGYHKKNKWYTGQEMPTFQEHISNAPSVSLVYVIVSASLMGMESASEEAFDWLVSEPKIAEAAGHYFRYMNDIGSYEREHNSGQFPTAVDCYMKENGVSTQETFDRFVEFGENAWKTVNKEWVNETSSIPRHILKPILNYTRVTFVTYQHGDGYTYAELGLRADIDALLFNPIIV